MPAAPAQATGRFPLLTIDLEPCERLHCGPRLAQRCLARREVRLAAASDGAQALYLGECLLRPADALVRGTQFGPRP